MSVKFRIFFKTVKWLMVLTTKLTLCTRRNLNQKLSFLNFLLKNGLACFGFQNVLVTQELKTMCYIFVDN